MVLLSSKTGTLEAVLLDKGYLTDIRTALAGAISVKYLAKKEISSVGIIGAGAQAKLIQAENELLTSKLNYENVIGSLADARSLDKKSIKE